MLSTNKCEVYTVNTPIYIHYTQRKRVKGAGGGGGGGGGGVFIKILSKLTL